MTIFTDKVKKYNTRLMRDLQVTKVQACGGIWGNVGGETGGFTALQEKKPTVFGSKGGYGWLQWTGPRRRKYEAWCTVRKLDPSSDEANYQYLVFETKTDELASLQALRKTTTLEAACETFMLKNLRPGIPNLSGRLRWAKKAWDAVKEEPIAVPPATTPDKTTGPVIATTGTVAATYAFWDNPYFWPVVISISLLALGLGILIHKHKNRTLK